LPSFPDVLRIDDRPVGHEHPAYIVAEAGSNHDGTLDTALMMVDAAADAGCDAVKFQTFTGEQMASTFANKATRLPEPFTKWGSNLKEFYEHLALPDHFHEPIAAHAAARGICFFSSPFSEEAVDRLARLGVSALKIASFELVHLPLIRHAAKTGLPLIMSTGMAGLGDIERAIWVASEAGASEIALLHCGSNYPLSVDGANLAAMTTLRAAFGVPVGYSDHTEGVAVPIAAAALGANLLEKHFTLDSQASGPDHGFALEPDELGRMVEGIRQAERAIGQPRKTRAPEESAAAVRGRRSVFSAIDLHPGDVLSERMIKVVRPGIGLEPLALDIVLGRPVRRFVAADSPLHWDDLLGDAS
jgi:sialic acid synthase SpsE